MHDAELLRSAFFNRSRRGLAGIERVTHRTAWQRIVDTLERLRGAGRMTHRNHTSKGYTKSNFDGDASPLAKPTGLPTSACFKCGARGWCKHRSPETE